MMQTSVMVIVFLQVAAAMLIPEDTEILDGFGSDFLSQISPEDDYFEARSLSMGPLLNSIRNKRGIEYEPKESDGLISHFRPNTVNSYAQRSERSIRGFKRWLKKKFASEEEEEETHRHRRSVEDDKRTKVELTNQKNKLTKTIDDPLRHDNPVAAALVGKFARSPFEYSKIQHEEDSMAMDTSSLSINEATKSRTPRVNFVTQQKKTLDHDDIKTSATKSDFYKTPPLLHDSKESTSASSSERYPDRSSTTRPSTYGGPDYKDRNVNSNRYDDRYMEDMYPPPPPSPPDMYDPIDYNDPYDSMMYRQPYYPAGNRYDIPDYRDYPPMYENEIGSRYFMRSDMMSPPMPPTAPRKRTIYYAYLPEVVRSPPTVDLRYRSYDRYDPYYPDYYNHYEANMVTNMYRRRPLSDRPTIPEKPTIRYDRRTSRPMKTYNEDIVRNSSSIKEKRIEPERSYNDNKTPMNAYFSRRPSEFDQFYY